MPNKRFTNHLFLFPSDALPKGPHILGLAWRPTQPSIRLLPRHLHLYPLPLSRFFPPSLFYAFSPGSLLYLAFLFFPIHIPPSIPTRFFCHPHPSLPSSLGPSPAPPFHFLFISLRLSLRSPVISLFSFTLPLFLSVIISNFVFLLYLFFILLYSSTSSKPCPSPPSPLSSPPFFFSSISAFTLLTFTSLPSSSPPPPFPSPPLILGYPPLPPFVFITLSILPHLSFPFSDSHLAFFFDSHPISTFRSCSLSSPLSPRSLGFQLLFLSPPSFSHLGSPNILLLILHPSFLPFPLPPAPPLSHLLPHPFKPLVRDAYS